MKKILMLMLLFTGTLKAETTWIPISNGGNFIIIPFIPTDSYPPTTNFSTKVLSGNTIVTWQSIEHASKYLIEVLNREGRWVELFVVSSNEFALSKLGNHYEFRVIACNINTCDSTGKPSVSFAPKKRVSFIHTDLLRSPVAETKE